MAFAAVLAPACAAASNNRYQATGSGGGATITTAGGGGGGDVVFSDAGLDGSVCPNGCSPDFRDLLDCHGSVLQHCTGTYACDPSAGSCVDACQAAVHSKQSVGCEYYATFMDQFEEAMDTCFAAFVANTWETPAHIAVDYPGKQLSVADFARIPSGAGPSLTYAPFDPAVGIPPGEVVILFLSGDPDGSVPCPVPPAVPKGAQVFQASGFGRSFRITSDVPVVAYQINPYGGGMAAETGASLLLPTSAWDKSYLAVSAGLFGVDPPSMNIVAMEDATHVTIVPSAPVVGGGAIPAAPAQLPLVFTLQRGYQAQFTQRDDLTGSVIQADKPIGFMAGHTCLQVPLGVPYCDHAEQMIPPISALGHEYVGVMFRPRVPGDEAIWRVVGVVDGTQLTWSSPVGGPATLDAGQFVEFITDEPFVVTSQDEGHPFMLFTYMSGSEWKPGMSGYGDADFVISVPPQQYLSRYVFFTDPTYPETNLVVVREKQGDAFKDVTLDCAGKLDGWQPVGDYEWTRVDLIRHDFQGVGNCSTGRHEIESEGRFGLWVWGWGTPETTIDTRAVSYGYPAGMNVRPINDVVLPIPQ